VYFAYAPLTPVVQSPMPSTTVAVVHELVFENPTLPLHVPVMLPQLHAEHCRVSLAPS
jgi:hypothetical protein